MSTPTPASTFIDTFNTAYLQKHKSFEDNFWATKMNLTNNSVQQLTETKQALDDFLNDASTLQKAQDLAKTDHVTMEELKVLKIIQRTLKCYIITNDEALTIKRRVTALENELAASRGKMKLGYTHPETKEFVTASSVVLRNKMRTADDEAERKACYEGLVSIGPFVLQNGFLEIVKERNKLAKQLGFEDFYDMKVTQAEGFNKKTLFGMLEELERESRPIAQAARARLAKEKGEDALQPYNTSYQMAGDVTKKQDPYFPFEHAVETWARSFSNLGIRYNSSTMSLDLCDREGKYSNGFCHWPVPPFYKSDGTWVPAQTNFTSLATPSQTGSGQTALTTLMHEGGHAAHFANITQRSPLFSQERAPTSVAYAETQSMFLDSLCNDAAWLAKYAKNRQNQTMPWDLVQLAIQEKQPYQSFMVRAMLAVPFFEKRLYELPEEEVTAEKVLQLAKQVEEDIQGGPSPRPLLSVPHILADEASCYYHGYVLAEMAVYQTRKYFLEKYGYIVDNPKVGPELTQHYWTPGNSEPYLGLVEKLTGGPLSCRAMVDELAKPLEEVLKEEKVAYEKAMEEAKGKEAVPIELNMRVKLVHGDEVISDSEKGGLEEACSAFQSWVREKYF